MVEKEMNLRVIFPNAVTMLALAFGVSSLNMALWGRWQLAVIFIAMAGLFDFMDGKVARLLGVSSKFGAELDSLSDFVSFGVAPGFLMYQWTMDSSMRWIAMRDLSYKADAIGIAWGLVLFVSMCCAARLARFNTMLDEKQPEYWKHFFMGVPAPAGGALAMLPLIMWLATDGQVDFLRSPWFVSIFVCFAGVMMASKIPTICLKHLHINRDYAIALMLVGLFLIAGLVAFTWVTFSIVGICYIVSIPFTVRAFLRTRRQYCAKK